MSILSSLLLAVLTAFSISAMEPTIESGHADHISVYIDNVGQGNLIRIKIPHKTEPKKAHIVVDCGSGSYRHEFDHIFKRCKKKGPRLTLDKLLQEKRRALGGTEENPLHIMALILTHPDSDHINQVPALFNHLKDQIDYIICGGLPEMYQKHDLDFGRWINQLIMNESRVYFPVISYDPIRNFSEVLPVHPDRYQSYNTAWAVPKFTSEDYTDHPFREFIEALAAINGDFRLYFLAVNPTHITQAGNTARLTNATTREEKEKETNTDSLVLKVSYGNASMILPGDATGITTTRLQLNYSAPFLKSPVLLLAHHGSITEGSNNDVWLNLVQPEYILISTGHKFGHPHQEALTRFESLKSLKDVTSHRISSTKEGSIHRDPIVTDKAIFLTYESGDLTTKLFKDGTVKLTTQIIEKESGDLEEEGHSPITSEERHSSSSSSDDEERELELSPSSSSSTHSKKRTHSPTKDKNRKKSKEDQSKTKGKGTGKKETQGTSSSKQNYNRKNLKSFLQYLTERNNKYIQVADSSTQNGYAISGSTISKITKNIKYAEKKDYSPLWKALKKAYPNDFKSWLNS